MKTILPSMFHRRLLLLSGLAAASVVPLFAQMSRLTIEKSALLREEAEARLVRRSWTPTVRGRILDRSGRVLAQDRPSFNVSVAYPVITGDWATTAARDAARKAAGVRWSIMTAEERAELAGRALPMFSQHLQAAWDGLAKAAGVPREELDRRRDEIITRVESRHQRIVEQRREKELLDLANRGIEPTTLDDRASKAMERRVTGPIEEQQTAHVILPQVSDESAFAVRGLAGETTRLDLAASLDAEPASGLGGPGGAGAGGPGGGGGGGRTPTMTVDRFPGLEVDDSGDRDYPFERVSVELDRSTLPSPIRDDTPIRIDVEGVACHILGRLRTQVHKEDGPARAAYLDAHPAARALAMTADGQDRGAYRDGDHVGQDGVEQSQEQALRGLRGVQTRFVDSGKSDLLPPAPGRDVTLTIDAMMQARVQAVMSPSFGLAVVQPWQGQESDTQPVGSALNGAAVVLDIDTGDVLALVSTPTFTREQLRTDPSAIFNDPVNTPWLDRAINKPYPPGSIVKALMLNGAVQHGNYSLDQRIACTGHLLPNQPNMLQCWIWKRYKTTHSAVLGADLQSPEAIMASCNIFFFTLGRRMGPQTITQVYREFGVGSPFALGIGEEFVGQLGADTMGGGLEIGDAIQMGIGQGPVSWTPLHAADAYATIARGGVRVMPRVVRGERGEPVDLRLDASAVAASLEGLRLSVNDERGTGHHILFNDQKEPIFNVPGVRVWGKTGTATAPSVMVDPDGPDGPMPKQVVQAGDHSWFVVLVGRDRPKFVISVVIDYGGSGGKVSGPITNQIIAALVREGHL